MSKSLPIPKTSNPDKLTKTGKPRSAETLRQLRLAENIKLDFEDGLTSVEILAKNPFGFWRHLRLRVPMPPSVNQWTRVWRGKAHASHAAKTYIDCMAKLLAKAKINPTYDKVKIEVRLYGLPPRSDVDGRNKCLLDALQGLVVFDDVQFRDQRAVDMNTDIKYGSYCIIDLKTL